MDFKKIKMSQASLGFSKVIEFHFNNRKRLEVTICREPCIFINLFYIVIHVGYLKNKIYYPKLHFRIFERNKGSK